MLHYTLHFRDHAEQVLETATRVLEALEEAEEAQKAASVAIEKANDDVTAAESDLTQVMNNLLTDVSKHYVQVGIFHRAKYVSRGTRCEWTQESVG